MLDTIGLLIGLGIFGALMRQANLLGKVCEKLDNIANAVDDHEQRLRGGGL